MSVEQATPPQVRPDGHALTMSLPHPLDQLSVAESDAARQVILDARGAGVTLNFRSIALEEPPKSQLVEFLELEHAGRVTSQTPRPARLAKVSYDTVRGDRKHEYTESLVDISSREEISQRVIDKIHQAALTT
jgi:primary-amine oxidase